MQRSKIKQIVNNPVKMIQKENFPEELRHLNEGKKWLENGTDIKIGDIVIVVEDAGPRNNWPLGRIVEVYPGKDGVTCVVDVKTAVGINKRPTSKIHRLDIRNEDEVPSSRGSM